jgi:uncharacterized protein YtpQ (UPF0354 family)
MVRDSSSRTPLNKQESFTEFSGKPMPDSTTWMDSLAARLADRRLEVDRVADTLAVKAGRGLTAAKANLDPTPLWKVLEKSQASAHERLIEGYVSGVKHVLLEPKFKAGKQSKASQWDYVESAGRLLANVEVHTFRHGAQAAAGELPWTLDFHEDLVLAYLVDLDIGMRVLTESQVEGWSASSERITAAARSLLFHKSRTLKPQTLGDFEGVEKLNAGDTYDAMRSIVVADLYFSEFDDSYRFSMPSQDALLFTRGHDDTQLEQLRAATDAHFDHATYPLSRSIYGFEVGRPVLDEERM